MPPKSIQDDYPDDTAVCYGCGRLNEHGLHIKSYWEGGESVASFQPAPYHTAVPGYTYGGLLASLIDCHATGTAAAAMYQQANRPPDSKPAFRFVTGMLNVRFEAPTPIGREIRLKARVTAIEGRKVTVHVDLYSGDVCTATGEVVVFQMPESFREGEEEDG